MSGYLTASRVLENLGWDPTPGDVEGTRDLARLFRDLGDDVAEMSAFLQGARTDLWTGQTARAYQEAMVEFPPRLSTIATAFGQAGDVLSGWAEDLAGFQARAATIDADLGVALGAERAAVSAAVPYLQMGPGAGQPGEREEALAAANAAADRVIALRAAADRLHDEFNDASKSYAARLDAAGDMSFGGGWSATIGNWVRDFGGWVSSSEVGDWIRSIAPSLSDISAFCGWASAGLAVAAGVSLFVLPPAAPFLALGASVVGAAGLATDTALAVAADGDWSAVAWGLAGLGVGKIAGKAISRINHIRRTTGVGTAPTVVRGVDGQPVELPPSLFTTTEMHADELLWQAVKIKSNQAQWVITGVPLVQQVTAHDVDNPWDLPAGTAYLTSEELAR